MAKTSPGPWKWDIGGNGHLEAADDSFVLLYEDHRGCPSDADETLIAAASEMLELLRRWVEAQDAWIRDKRAIMTTEEWERDVRPLLERLK